MVQTSVGLSSNPEWSASVYWEAVKESQQELQSIIGRACIPCMSTVLIQFKSFENQQQKGLTVLVIDLV